MSFLNSALGGMLGFAIGGPLGGILGAVIGSKLGSEKRQSFSSNQRNQAAFFTALFACLSKIAKADGVVSREEVDKVDSFIKDRFNFPSDQRHFAIQIFNDSRKTVKFFYFFDFFMHIYYSPILISVPLTLAPK